MGQRQAVTVEVSLNGVWTAVTGKVRVEESTIRTGSADGEQNNRGPSACTLTFDNRSGEFSPLNPESPFYGRFGRGTLLRLKVATSVRFVGYVTTLEPEFDLSGRDQTVKVEARGIRQRLMQNAQPLKTTLERGIPTMDGIVGYWPMTGSQYQREWADELGVNGLATPGGKVKPGEYNGHPAAGNIPVFKETGGSTVEAQVGAAPTTGHLRMMAFVSIPDDLSAWAGWATVFILKTQGASSRAWRVQMDEFGSLRVTLQTGDGSQVIGTSWAFHMAGRTGLLWIMLNNSGVNSVDTQIGFAAAEKNQGLIIAPDTFTGAFTGAANEWIVLGKEDMAIGHVSIHNVDDFFAVLDYASAWDGERAADRFQRLAAEENVPAIMLGGGNTERMGMQRESTFLDLMDECADADDALSWDASNDQGLAFRNRGSLYSQAAELTLDYAAGHLSPPLAPVIDDRLAMNDVTVKRADGGQWRSVERSGPMGVDVIGAYTSSEERNLTEQAQTVSMARWLLHRGTAEGARFEKITVDVLANPGLIVACESVEPGSFIEVVNLPRVITPDAVRLLVVGVEERVDAVRRSFTFVCVPGSPYEVAYVHGSDPNTNQYSRVDADGSTVASPAFITGTSTGLVVNSPNLPWTTSAAEWPFKIRVDGAILTVSAVSAVVAGQQGFTVSTTVVNGVVKTLTPGAEVHVEPTANVAA